MQLSGLRSNDSLIEPGSPISGLNAHIPTNPGLNATVLAPNGTDITSNFKIMFYRSPSVVALDGLNEKARRKRQVDLGDEPQIQCQSPTAVFAFSHCIPKGNLLGTSRMYQVYCRERSQTSATRPIQEPKRPSRKDQYKTIKYLSGRPNDYYRRPEAEPPGMCREDQICMDGPLDWAKANPTEARIYRVARCVSARNFKQLPSVNDLSAMLNRASGDASGSSTDNLAGSSNDHQAGSSSDQDLSGNSLSLRLTNVDEEPLPANIEVDSGEARTQRAEGTIESHPCRDPCLELSMREFPRSTNWVSAHARLVSALTVAGVLWVVLF